MVRAIMIVEMAGRPAEHLTAAIEKHIGVLNDVDDVTVHSIKVSEPREIKVDEVNGMKGGEKMFTCFAEADFECDSFARLSETMFDFMPSSVEVIEPAKVTMNMSEATDLLNNISGRMHRYDEIAKVLGERYRLLGVQLENAKKILAERDAEILKLGKGKKKAVKKKKVKRTVKKVKKK
jgi:hypothetical protein